MTEKDSFRDPLLLLRMCDFSFLYYKTFPDNRDRWNNQKEVIGLSSYDTDFIALLFGGLLLGITST